jgi:hypothetical protein
MIDSASVESNFQLNSLQRRDMRAGPGLLNPSRVLVSAIRYTYIVGLQMASVWLKGIGGPFPATRS